MLNKNFDYKAVEHKYSSVWKEKKYFQADVKSQKEKFCIMMPPPNVTGSLHIGHAFNHSIQDCVARFERMRGKDMLWQPGTDHAGIATQMMVERLLAQEGKTSRQEMGREKFLERVWEWKEESGGTIVSQLNRLGASADWSRERFTMDEGLNEAVTRVFVDLYKEGLIYKDKRLVNWDPKLKTAISDLEVEQKEVDGFLYYIKYPLVADKTRFITIATTRPETMLADVAVAVHPEHPIFKSLIGQKLLLPLTNREIPIIADEYADIEFGTGAVKITPAHDFNDFEVGKRHNLEMINIFDAHAHLVKNDSSVPKVYQGMERSKAREAVVADLEAQGYLEKKDPHKHMVPFGDRSGVILEPWLTDQWYCDAKTLAQPAIKAVESGEVQFIPSNWDKTYFEWMYNIQPWCISRQLWWGHQIPAWYTADGDVFVAMDEPEAQKLAEQKYGKTVELTRDPDVLDTWFSSALWPFSTLGWPHQTPELERYFPTELLITGFDIIFFWVARMMMMSYHFMKKPPFKKVYIHALVRDEFGQKMSKTKGNVIDPLEVIEKYGTDALRFTLYSMAAQGRDIKLSVGKVESYRNFVTKIWNAARFCEMNGCEYDPNFDPKTASHQVNKWIFSKLVLLTQEVTKSFEDYRFNDAASSLYAYIWGSFCDWYLELTKCIYQDESSQNTLAISETKKMSAYILKQMMLLLHPFMPYITEEITAQLGLVGNEESHVCVAAWPNFEASLCDQKAIEQVDWLISCISIVRNIRAEVRIPYSQGLKLYMKGLSQTSKGYLEQMKNFVMKVPHVTDVEVISDSGSKDISGLNAVLGEATLIIPIDGVIDLSKEKQRLEKELSKLEEDIRFFNSKLSNQAFVDKAPPKVLQEHKSKLEDAMLAKQKLDEAMHRISGL